MNLIKVIFLSFIISIILATGSYFLFDITVSLGLILGAISWICSMIILVNKFRNIDLSDYNYLQKSMKGNLGLRYLIYLVALLLGVFLPKVFHVLGVFI